MLECLIILILILNFIMYSLTFITLIEKMSRSTTFIILYYQIDSLYSEEELISFYYEEGLTVGSNSSVEF